MGARSNTETIVAILRAFLEQRTWKQADLARHTGVSTATVHKRLYELLEHGIPLAHEKEHPHVFWSVPKTWYPGGVLLTGEQMTQLLRLLSRLPKSAARDRLIEQMLVYLPTQTTSQAVRPREQTAREERSLPAIEDAANQRIALRFDYFSANRGSEGARRASVHRVLPGPPARFLATCHRTNKLKWFRVHDVLDCTLDRTEPFREVDTKVLDEHLHASLNGFHAGDQPTKHAFFVTDPDARWVARNLIDGMTFEDVSGGIRVTVETAALDRLARFVVGLGASARPLTAALAQHVAALARGALSSIGTRH